MEVFNGEIAQRAIHKRVSGGSGKIIDGRGLVYFRGVDPFIFAEDDLRALEKGFQTRESGRDRQGSAVFDGTGQRAGKS
jgi:hypothetical protein